MIRRPPRSTRTYPLLHHTTLCRSIYFGERFHSVLNSLRGAFVCNFAHYFIFASAAAVGAGIAVLVDHITHHSEISRALANMAVAAPVAVYLLAVWFCHDRPSGRDRKSVV